MRTSVSGGGVTREGRQHRFTALLRLWASIALALGLLVTGVGPATSTYALQESTPDAEATTNGEEPTNDEATEESEPSGSAGPSADLSLSEGQPAVLSQGLTFVTEGKKVWTVTEVDVPAVDDASSEAGGTAIWLQREGATIIRNDVTGKRAKIEAGESFFRAADDAYTLSADGSSSTLWRFELVDVDSADADAFYEGRVIEGLSEAVYDLEVTRFILAPGETAELPDYNDTGLTMVISGGIEVQGADTPAASLSSGDGQTMLPGQGSATVENSGSEVAMYIFVALGDEVSDETAGAGTASQPAETEEEPVEEPDTEPETVETPNTSVVETPETETEEPPVTGDGTVTSINVSALAEIYIVVTVDGVTAYDGTLAAGQSTGAIVGGEFSVYTSSGVNTQFTNACGSTFSMGSEEGEATYYLAADAESCAP